MRMKRPRKLKNSTTPIHGMEEARALPAAEEAGQEEERGMEEAETREQEEDEAGRRQPVVRPRPRPVAPDLDRQPALDPCPRTVE